MFMTHKTHTHTHLIEMHTSLSLGPCRAIMQLKKNNGVIGHRIHTPHCNAQVALAVTGLSEIAPVIRPSAHELISVGHD